MNDASDNIIKDLIENSRKINSKAFNLTRCILLSLIGFYKDGLQFRELKVFLNISDGKLQSNLDFLLEMGYIRKFKVELDQKTIHIFMIDKLGINELKKIIKWVDFLKKLVFKNG
jgi:DNA-binding MarR family transcriptional regulator